MTDYTIDVPAPDDDVELNPLTDTLTINFTEKCKFCSPTGAAGYFSPALPNGVNDKGTSWKGTPQTAGADQTISHHSVAHDKDCDSKKRAANRTIQIGSGKP
jgi:hypothetical protein